MKEFICDKRGNLVFKVVLAVVIFLILNVAIGLGGAIAGGIAGFIGFGGGDLLKRVLKPAGQLDEIKDGDDKG